MVKNWSRISLCLIFLSVLISISGLNLRSIAKSRSVCPHELESLTEQMLLALPSYANRVIQRSKRRTRSERLDHYVIVAGRPEFKPLPLRPTESQYTSIYPDTTQQIFFTTLERQYSQDRVVKIQNYHWLFLTENEQGWQLVMVFSQLSSSNPHSTSLPPQDTTNGVIGQAIKIWLRDCQFNSR